METTNDRAQLPRNMIENSMFEEEPDVVDLAKEPSLNPLESEDVEYEPRSSRLLVRGLGEHEMDDDEEDYESSAKLLGMSFMNRNSGPRNNGTNYRQVQEGLCPVPSVRTVIVCAVVVVIAVSLSIVIYLLPKCTFTKEGCHIKKHEMELVYPIATNGRVFPWAKSRLPRTILPIHYELTLYPNLTTSLFNGLVKIKLNVTEDSKNIILHSSNLKISNANVTIGGGKIIQAEILEYPTFEEIAFLMPETLTKGIEYVLTIEYSANLSESYQGFYKISSKESSSRCLAATQFEPLSARKAFPCFDEPAFKSVFQINIKRDEDHISLSNMPRTNTSKTSDGLFLDEFATSVKMSTYLVAFIVADMKSISKQTEDILVSVYATPQKMNQIQYALDTAVKLLDFYSTFLDKYPLQKLDLVAIPDFQAGAMENWGLITFREVALLYNENSSSILDKQSITAVIAHELAHQWFGNLVTMEWWNDLWLNEGLASYMEYFSLGSEFTELNADDGFLSMRFKAMKKDSFSTSHPISTDVQSREQIEEMFDEVSYIKGASLLLMLKTYLSEEDFKRGLNGYLMAHKYGSTKSEDLWDSMNLITKGNPDVKNMMKTWTQHAGFPLVTVLKKGKEVFLSQERFLLKIDLNNTATNSSAVWHVPLTYLTIPCYESKCENEYLLKQEKDKINLTKDDVTVKFNVKMSGFYIVDYGVDGWNSIILQLHKNHTVLHSSDRANLIHDIFTLAGVGKVPLEKAFDLIEYLVNETSVAPIKEALHQLQLIHSVLDKRGLQILAGKIVHRTYLLLESLITSQSWTDEGSPSDQELRSILLNFACSQNVGNCTAKARELYDTWKSNNSRLPTDVMSIVFKVGAQDEENWNSLFTMYGSSLFEAEKSKLLEALASTNDGRKLIWLMNESLKGGLIKSQELATVIHFISKNIPGHLLAWDFVKQNWELIIQKFPPGSYPIQSIVSRTTSQFSTQVSLNEVRSFFQSTKGKSNEMRCVKEAIETIELNIQWVKNNLDSLQQWL
ncbi:leucyl-cystinyl aminopeptidase [Bombina bombina]|uniref:leucyl-cystinyl aminopeptidase n=1 Tax=Bombina bombina TaxID=8345 RepID=UPI00235A7146|nr:leucyl-cystinyl aminopeptidase [Bombina bombina]